MSGPNRHHRQEFHEKHGSNCVDIGGGWFLYEDGAQMEKSSMGFTREPPHDPHELAQLQVRYYDVLAKRTADQFHDFKQQLKARVGASEHSGYPPPSSAELEKLKELRKLARQRQRQLQEARKRLEAATPARLRQHRSDTAVDQQRAQQRRYEINGIKL